MDDDSFQLLTGNPACLRVLRMYHDLATQSAAQRDDGSQQHWCERIKELDELDAAALTSIHGRLIALGWLTFQLEDGKNGLTYRVSSEGRRALSGPESFPAEEHDADQLAAA